MIHARPGYRHRNRIPRGSLGAPDAGPFEGAMAVGAERYHVRTILAVLGAFAGHGFVAWLAWVLPPRVQPPPPKHEIPIIVAARPPPPAPTPPKPPPPEPPPPKRAEARHVRAVPAQAPKVVAARADPNAPVDMTGFSMPVGEAAVATGGYVSSTGTGHEPVLAKPVEHHGPPAPSLAKPAEVTDPDWSCTWPDAEQASETNDTHVIVDIHVTASGDPSSVNVKKSPNDNFANAAKACVFDQKFDSALDNAGKPISGIIRDFDIHFIR